MLMNGSAFDNLFRIRPACPIDMSQILEVFNLAREQMYQSGNRSQWSVDYPSEQQLLKDIAEGYLYLCFSNNELCAVFALIFGEDPTYRVIYEGKWLNDAPYATLHRVAGSGRVKGIGRFILDWCLERSQNLRVDTHADNGVMLHLLQSMGFRYCGIIYVANGTARLAFQKSL